MQGQCGPGGAYGFPEEMVRAPSAPVLPWPRRIYLSIYHTL